MSDNINTSPFAVGQKVVAIKTVTHKTDPRFKIVEGMIYTVKATSQCPCGRWRIDVGIRHDYSYCECTKCHRKTYNDILWTNSSYFAPIETKTVEIAAEILSSIKHTDEVPDKILIPETAN